ncbi:MAG: hypothetical protein ABFQ95_04080 [Pseudomonadota bacterium]
MLVFALAISFLIGRQEEKANPTQYKSTVSAPAYSTFRRGFDALRKYFVQTKEAAIMLVANLMPPLSEMAIYAGETKNVR